MRVTLEAPSPAALQPEVEAVHRVITACRAVSERPEASLRELLEAVRRALGADELVFIAERGDAMTAILSPTGEGRTLHDHAAAALDPRRRSNGVDIAGLARSVGMRSPEVAGAFGHRGHPVELLAAGWRRAAALPEPAMAMVAGVVSISAAALEARRTVVVAARDQERANLAFALHDGLIQAATGSVLALETVIGRLNSDPEGAIGDVEEAKDEIRRSLVDLRATLFDLSAADQAIRPRPRRNGGALGSSADPSPLAGPEPAPPTPAEYIQDVVTRWGLPARVAIEGDLRAVPPAILSVAYGVIREALANSAKHAPGAGVSVTLGASNGDLTVTITDSGRGFDAGDEESARRRHHLGLQLIRRRVRQAGGTLQVQSRRGRGTSVVARLPFQARAS